jgi:exodeoxyribonuclease-5
MIKTHITNTLKSFLSFEPNQKQLKLLDLFSDFLVLPNSRELLLIKGFAGTGKTSMIGVFIKALKSLDIKTVLMAPTGRAAKVLSGYSEENATTIHKKIYRQKTAKDAFGDFSLDRNLHSNTFFFVDEASMLSDQSYESSMFGSGNLLQDLITYVYNDKNCKLILVGDTAQLPPVGQTLSNAMSKNYLEMFNLNVNEIELTEVMRQAEDSGILLNATIIRESIPEEPVIKPKLQTAEIKDISRIGGPELMDAISSAYHKYGINDTIIICRSNKIANRYNQGIRNHVLSREEELSAGDILMVVKNNYYWAADHENLDFIANGDIAKIKKVRKYQELYGFRFADIDVVFPDYDNLELSVKILLDTLYSEAPALSAEEHKRLFFTIADDYADITVMKKRYAQVRENKYFNALQVKFGYAVTCHKSQGGQWNAVFIDQSYFRDEMLTTDYLKWLYTAFTRATEKIFLVNFDNSFFE